MCAHPCTDYAHSVKINATVFKCSDSYAVQLAQLNWPCLLTNLASQMSGRTIYGNFKITRYSDDSC